MKHLLSILVLLTFCLGASASWADGYRYSYYGVTEGLCDEYVLSTYKDRTGYLWVCTSNGLDRFDGNRFVHFSSHSDDPGTRINNDFVYSVTEDIRGDIWVVTNSGLLCIHVQEGTISFPEDLGSFRDRLSQPMIGILSTTEDCSDLRTKRSLACRPDAVGNVEEVTEYPSALNSLRYISMQDDLIWVGVSPASNVSDSLRWKGRSS